MLPTISWEVRGAHKNIEMQENIEILNPDFFGIYLLGAEIFMRYLMGVYFRKSQANDYGLM